MNKLVRVVAVAALTLALALVGACPAAAQTDNRVTVAGPNFDMSNVRQWWSWHWDVSADMSGLVSEALVGKGNFRVLERSQIQSILAEQDFGHSGRVDESQAVEIGRLLGARLLIFGTITAFDYASTGGIQIFGVGLSGSKAVTELSGRIVDALTGEILGSVTGYGEESGTTFSLNTYRGLSFASREFQNSTVGKSVQQAVDSFASAAAGKINEVAANLAAEAQRPELTGVVAAIIDAGVVINIGSSAGVRVGQRMEVYRLTFIPGLMDPVRVPVGTMRIISVDPNASIGQMESEAAVQVGDLVSSK